MAYLFSDTPWNIERQGDRVRVTSGLYTVAEVYATSTEFYEEFTQDANASLIAAAPEMYSLLERVSIALDVKSEELQKKLLNKTKEDIRRLFLLAGVTITQYRLREIERERQEVELAKAKKEIDEEMAAHDDEAILKEYFGDKASDYILDYGDVGYHAVNKNDEDEEWFLLKEDGVHPTPYYLNNYAWFSDCMNVAYVHQDSPGQRLVSYDEGNWYQFDEIKDAFIEAGVNPDMDTVGDLIKGQSVQELIKDYIEFEKKCEEEENE